MTFARAGIHNSSPWGIETSGATAKSRVEAKIGRSQPNGRQGTGGRDAISRFSPDSLQSSLTSKRLDYLTVRPGPSSCSGVINSRRSATN